MATLLYQRPADQLLTGSVTITPTSEDPDYPSSLLYDGNPAKLFKLDDTDGSLLFDFGVATNIDLVALIHHNLDAGLANVKIQGNATTDFTAPTLNETIVIPAYEGDGFPVNPWLDLSALPNSFRYWRLVFETPNSVNIMIGQLWLGGTKRNLVHNINWGFNDEVERRIIEHVTDYGVSTIYDLGCKIKSWNVQVETSAAGIAALEAWWDACHGRALGTLVVLDPAVNDARLVRWATTVRTIERRFFEDHVLQFGLKEISRGLVP